MALLCNMVRALILDASDAINEHDEKLGYAIREAVSGRTVYADGERKVECNADNVRRMLLSATGRTDHVDRAIGAALIVM